MHGEAIARLDIEYLPIGRWVQRNGQSFGSVLQLQRIHDFQVDQQIKEVSLHKSGGSRHQRWKWRLPQEANDT